MEKEIVNLEIKYSEEVQYSTDYVHVYIRNYKGDDDICVEAIAKLHLTEGRKWK